jgi:O-Antigen ligase
MRRAVSAIAAVCLLLGPTALAFFSGGYYAEPRLIGALLAWALVLALAIAGPSPLPRSLGGWLAAGGLAALAVWSAISLVWAPLGGPAIASVQRLVLYLGALLAGLGALRSPRALRAAEPALAAGATVVIGYGLAGRLVPGIVHLSRSLSAAGRLEQPITYWNAEGLLAAFGLVLCARLAGDRSRPGSLRCAAAAAVVPLGAGTYLSYSRGAIVAAVIGLAVLVASAPTTAQLRAAAGAAVLGGLAAGISATSGGVASLDGTLADRERAGALVLVALAVLAATGALLARRETRAPDIRPAWAHRLAPTAAIVVAVAVAGVIAGALAERPTAAELAAGAQAQRLTTVSSNRYEYWRVALAGFADHPLRGLGAGGFRVLWLERRTIPESVRDTHSIELEMAADLGIPGLLCFGVMVAGVVLAGRRALQRRRFAAAGAVAALGTWLVHASIDWDWQLPAVTLPAIALAAALVVLSETGR